MRVRVRVRGASVFACIGPSVSVCRRLLRLLSDALTHAVAVYSQTHGVHGTPSTHRRTNYSNYVRECTCGVKETQRDREGERERQRGRERASERARETKSETPRERERARTLRAHACERD